MNSYLYEEVTPIFKQWVMAQNEVVHADKKHGQYFLANHVDATKVESRGCVYEWAEALCNYAKIDANGNISEMHHVNMKNMADSISWAIQHDGFDAVKWDPIDCFGHDIVAVKED